MIDTRYFPDRIFIDRSCQGLPLTRRVVKNAEGIPVEIIDDVHAVIEGFTTRADPISFGKSSLLITSSKGDFLKACPCTPSRSKYLGCGYSIINTDLNCPLNCTYCILQIYLKNPMVTVYSNTEDLWRELDRFFARTGLKNLRMGTGELGDSLVLDHLTERSRDLITYFRSKPQVLFELKTKTVNTEHVLAEESAPNVVVSWSLNSEKMAAQEELGAPSVEERIEAAREVGQKGFSLAFHFDPLIHYPGWEEGYGRTIERLFRRIRPEQIAWISLGSLRFPPDLYNVIRKRFPDSKIIFEEMVRGLDGKLRYFRPLRREMYKHMVRSIKEAGGGKIRLYFCMETQEMWREVLKKKPKGEEAVEDFLSSPLGRLDVG